MVRIVEKTAAGRCCISVAMPAWGRPSRNFFVQFPYPPSATIGGVGRVRLPVSWMALHP
ncbi:MAG: hypothetical protein CM1200mP2_57410 [Planctomycetaceae bacterium]|nr:MAG: hypothetical protein CM1200mP2_57410 [Planctomycetaceae bacterium]